MEKPEYHLLVCLSFRGIEPKGKCITKGSLDLLQYLESEIADRGLNAMVSSTGCLKTCDHGPVLVIYPQGEWYGPVENEEVIDEILDAPGRGPSQ